MSGAALHFSKMHGAGNDFVVLDLRDGAPPPDAGLAAQLADRHFGVGCDQILTVEPPRSAQAVAAYRIWNADGSTSEQCGNGARCVAAWLVRAGVVADPAAGFRLDSPTRTHRVESLGQGRFAVAMGVPAFDPAAVPMAGTADLQLQGDLGNGDAAQSAAAQGEYQIVVQGRPLRFGAVSMGNPHAVLQVEDVAQADVAAIAPLLQAHPVFPRSVNVGFAEIVARDRILLRVYERGSGETLACGSGACAAAAVLMQRGAVDRTVAIALPGGELSIHWPDPAGELIMAGPAAFVFEGEWLR